MTQSPDLYALIIRLIATQNGRLQATQGHLAHAAFLDILRQVDPSISQTIHDMHGRKPFTISPLEGYGHGHNGVLSINIGQEGWLRVTLLNPLLFQTFINYFLEGTNKPTIKLENQVFHVSEILSTPTGHKLAGYDTLNDMYTRWEQPNQQSSQLTTIQLHFRTPTAFSMRSSPHRYMHILPDPVLVFGQLADYWDNLTGSDTRDAIRFFCAENVVVARYNLETHMYQYRRSKQVGFTGKVGFEILEKKTPDITQHLNRLADLAFYTGVGSKTTQGMGQVNRF
ncbi:MAG: CRISPR-associated endoribonuclease Cas6 [Chloroflexota bacterium]